MQSAREEAGSGAKESSRHRRARKTRSKARLAIKAFRAATFLKEHHGTPKEAYKELEHKDNMQYYGKSYHQGNPRYHNRDLGKGFSKNQYERNYDTDYDQYDNDDSSQSPHRHRQHQYQHSKGSFSRQASPERGREGRSATPHNTRGRGPVGTGEDSDYRQRRAPTPKGKGFGKDKGKNPSPFIPCSNPNCKGWIFANRIKQNGFCSYCGSKYQESDTIFPENKGKGTKGVNEVQNLQQSLQRLGLGEEFETLQKKLQDKQSAEQQQGPTSYAESLLRCNDISEKLRIVSKKAIQLDQKILALEEEHNQLCEARQELYEDGRKLQALHREETERHFKEWEPVEAAQQFQQQRPVYPHSQVEFEEDTVEDMDEDSQRPQTSPTVVIHPSFFDPSTGNPILPYQRSATYAPLSHKGKTPREQPWGADRQEHSRKQQRKDEVPPPTEEQERQMQTYKAPNPHTHTQAYWEEQAAKAHQAALEATQAAEKAKEAAQAYDSQKPEDQLKDQEEAQEKERAQAEAAAQHKAAGDAAALASQQVGTHKVMACVISSSCISSSISQVLPCESTHMFGAVGNQFRSLRV